MNRFQELAFGKSSKENYLMTRILREPKEQRYSTRRMNAAAPGMVRVAQAATATSAGFSFKFYLLGGSVQGYRIYRSTINNSNVASVASWIEQPPTFTTGTTVQWQETTADPTVYYWVAAVSPSGREGERAKIPMTGTGAPAAPPDTPPVPDPGEGGGGGSHWDTMPSTQ